MSRLSVFTPTLKPGAEEGDEGMIGHRGHRADLGVAGRRHLEMDASVEHVSREGPKDEATVSIAGGVAIEADAVADAMRSVGQRVRDQFEIWGLARVNGDVEVSFASEREGVGVQ